MSKSKTPATKRPAAPEAQPVSKWQRVMVLTAGFKRKFVWRERY